MKLLALSGACIGLLGLATVIPAAQAADGTITFNGKITGQTCTINGNGSGSKDFTVTLPTVSKSSLSAAGDWAGRTPFNISLSECTPTTGNVATYFEPGASVDLTTGQLIVDSSANAAKNVELGLLNKDTSAIKVGATLNGVNNSGSQQVALENGAATLNYYVQYVAYQAAAQEGSVTSRVQYTIIYN